MRFVLFNRNLKKLAVLFCLGLTSMLIAACSGGGGSGDSGGGGGIPVNPVKPAGCIDSPDSNTLLPTQGTSPDQVWHDYVYNPASEFKIYGYDNPDPVHAKKIQIINNHSKIIFPVIFSPSPFTGSDGLQKTISRIFVGKPSCADATAFYAGLPANSSTTIYVPKQLWNAGHVKIFTEVPPLLQEDVNAPIQNAIYTVDKIEKSPNYGSLLYTSGTANDFPQELPFQLAEYTFESNCFDDNPTCAAITSDKLTVDFDISAVDQLMLPEALEELTGSRGYVGTNMNVTDFQTVLRDFVRGVGDSSFDPNVGWPYYYGSSQENGYQNNLIKMPMGFFTLNSVLFPSPTPYDPNHVINSLVVLDKISGQTVGDQTILDKVVANITPRWSDFWQVSPTICNGQADQAFCGNFVKTLSFLHNNIETACQFSLAGISLDPALCTTPGDPRSVATDIDKIKAFVGYTPRALTFDNPGGTYPAVDADNICMSQFDANPVKDGQFYSNCLRDAAKSALRGVPYPFWLYPDQFYPDVASIYTLNPVIWLVHKKLGLSEYAFSVDDDIGNQELVGNGFSVAVGGVDGLISTNAFNPKKLQILAFPGGSVNPVWEGTVSSSAGVFSACIPGKVGACDLNIQTGGYKSVEVSLTRIPGLPSVPGVPNPTLNFTITSGSPTTCKITGLPDYEYTPLVVTNCSASAGLKNCETGLLPVVFSDPDHSCAQTVNPSIPTL